MVDKSKAPIVSSGKGNLSERVSDIVSGREADEMIRILSEALEAIRDMPQQGSDDLTWGAIDEIARVALDRVAEIVEKGI